ncbi:MAG TPA: hypothetical protein ENK50_10715 [Sedimenticola sp.]|nr:hypothetical protein [Sedimenticola sp.]
MKTLRSTFIPLLLLVVLPALAAQGIAPTDDLSASARAARGRDMPILIVFSAAHCPYCERMKEEVLLPLMQGGGLNDKVVVTEVRIDNGGKLTDFDGDRVRSRIFVSRYDVFATPTVLLVDAEGHPLTAPIVGFDGGESYGEKLQHLINRARVSQAVHDRERERI